MVVIDVDEQVVQDDGQGGNGAVGDGLYCYMDAMVGLLFHIGMYYGVYTSG